MFDINRKTSLLLVGLCLSIFSCGSPAPHLEFILIPEEMTVGKTSQIILQLSNQSTAMGINDKGILDITFVGDPNVRVTIDSQSDRWENQGIYTPGTTIYHKDTGGMTAKDLLVSPESMGWDAKEKKKLVLNVTPSKSGVLSIMAGSVFVLKSGSGVEEIRHPDNGQNINQQGHPCLVKKVNVK